LPDSPTQDRFQALQAALLGLHRRELDPTLQSSFGELGIDQELPAAEQLLEAISLLDRLSRAVPP